MDRIAFRRNITIHLKETDATGVIYFAEQLRMAQETLEFFLAQNHLPLGRILKEEPFFLPVVHAEADYIAPIFVGDELEIELKVEAIGSSSFTLGFTYLRQQVLVGKAQLIHVTVNKETRRPMPIPEKLRTILVGVQEAVGSQREP